MKKSEEKKSVEKKPPVVTEVSNNDMMVVTVQGDSHPLQNCKKYSAGYYLIGRDIHKIDGNFYLTKDTITDLHTNTKYPVSSKHSLVKVVDAKNNIAYSSKYMWLYTRNPLFSETTRQYMGGYLIPYYNPDHKPHPSLSNMLKLQVCINTKDLNSLENIVTSAIRNSDNRVYNTKDYRGFNELNADKLESSNKYSFLPKEFTYGFELETSNGQFVVTDPLDYGFVVLYDGSITGHEYASIPLTAEKLINVENFCDKLNKNHTTNKFCSTHIHIGGIPYSEKNLIALYSLFYRLQDELHELCSPYKKNLHYLANKSRGEAKDHCQYLPKLPVLSVESIAKIFFHNLEITAEDFRSSKSEKILNGTQKWNVLSRYYYVNFTNYCLKKGGTLELRLLQGTFNSSRIMNWLLINVAVIQYALHNADLITKAKDKIFLEDCLEFYYKKDSKVYQVLTQHIQDTKLLNFNSKVNGDYREDDIYFKEKDIVNFKL